jgi:hypothetical protein
MRTNNEIQSLTPEQLAAISEYANKWLSIGSSTDPTDEDKGTAAIVKMYEIAGYKAPKVYWFDSPLAALLAAAADANVDAELDSKINGEALNEIAEQVYDQIFDMVKSHVIDQVSNQVFDEVKYRLLNTPHHQSIPSYALDQVRDQVRDQAHNLVKLADILEERYRCGRLPGSLGMIYHGALYDFFANALHLDIDFEKLAGLIGVAEQASIVYTFRDRAYAVRKIRQSSFDEHGRLHCGNGPAVLFHDGFAIYAWHGRRLFGKGSLWLKSIHWLKSIQWLNSSH